MVVTPAKHKAFNLYTINSAAYPVAICGPESDLIQSLVRHVGMYFPGLFCYAETKVFYLNKVR